MGAFPEETRLSPNVSLGEVNACYGVVVHHSVLSYEETIRRMLDPASEVSYHALIDEDGSRCILALDTSVAWHAGASSFAGRQGCNRFMLGLAFAGDTYRAALTRAQLDSAREWWLKRRSLHGWDDTRLVDHRQVSPGRKDDLNPTEWERVRLHLCS